jgi:hypothetical protein
VLAEHAAPKDEREERVIGSSGNLLIVRLVSVRCRPTVLLRQRAEGTQCFEQSRCGTSLSVDPIVHGQ